MATLVSGLDGVLIDGKVVKQGHNVPGSKADLDGYRRAGAVFEGDPAGGPVVLVSTPENPIPTGLDGNSALAEHKEAVKAKRESAAAAEEIPEAAEIPQTRAAEPVAVRASAAADSK